MNTTCFARRQGIESNNKKEPLELVETRHFRTRQDAKHYVESQLRRWKNPQRYYHKGDQPSNCYGFTDMTWTHENTGEEMQEYYQYTIKKVDV